MIRLKSWMAIVLAGLILCIASTSQAAPKSELWQFWNNHDATSTRAIDHSVWDRFIKQFVLSGSDGLNRFDYARVGQSDLRQLRGYLEQLSKTPIRQYNRDQQRAYWINLYNALTIEVVMGKFPVQSIRDISSGFFYGGPWDMKLIDVEGQALTLNDIEHRILRPIWKDPRIHYAVNCASIGCPNLQTEAFTAANSEALLEKAAHDYINHPRGARVVDGKLQVSSIYIWYLDDFGGNDSAVIAHLKRYAGSELKLALNDITEIDNDRYDWKINSLSPPKKIRAKRIPGS